MSEPKDDIVCISTIDWDFVWQGHQEIMSTFARAGHRVLFIENTGVRRPTLKDLPRIRKRIANWRAGIYGIRRLMDNLYVYSPLVLPFPYSRVARFINRLIMVMTLRSW
ncbi:MAG: glycosyltransferase family 1 protein, partial [Nitrospira sp.]|nr:glycosyltransferase family 1 protein [Nitrospira sp.]